MRLLLACIGEDEGVEFIQLPSTRKAGDWTYEIEDINHITLHYWITQHRSFEESIPNACCANTPRERAALQSLLLQYVRALKAKVSAL